MARFTREQREAGHDSLREKGRNRRLERDLADQEEPVDDVPDEYRDAFTDLLREEGDIEEN